MKKLNNLKKLLVAVGVMGSLSFVNCYAAQNEQKANDLKESIQNNSLAENMPMFTLNNLPQQNQVAQNVQNVQNIPLAMVQNGQAIS